MVTEHVVDHRPAQRPVPPTATSASPGPASPRLPRPRTVLGDPSSPETPAPRRTTPGGTAAARSPRTRHLEPREEREESRPHGREHRDRLAQRRGCSGRRRRRRSRTRPPTRATRPGGGRAAFPPARRRLLARARPQPRSPAARRARISASRRSSGRHDDDLEIGVVLGEVRADRGLDARVFVAGGHNDGDAGAGRGVRRAARQPRGRRGVTAKKTSRRRRAPRTPTRRRGGALRQRDLLPGVRAVWRVGIVVDEPLVGGARVGGAPLCS